MESSQKPEEAPQVEMNTTGSTVPTSEKAEASEYDYSNTESRLRNMIVFRACSRCMRQQWAPGVVISVCTRNGIL